MYAVYNYQAGSTAANISADLIKILTGETNKANLSANCVQANTSILSTVPAGWTVWDAAAGTNAQCIRALNQDGTTYKYYTLQAANGTTIGGTVSEAWNAATHTGTNTTTQSTCTWDSSGGGYFYIYATSKNIVIMPWITTGYINGNGLSVFEVSRDTIPATYPCHYMVNSFASMGQSNNTSGIISRIKNQSTTGDTTNHLSTVYITAITSGLGTAGGTGMPGSSTSTFRDASENVNLALYRVGVSTQAMLAGQVYDILCTGSTAASNLDEIIYSGTNYVCMKGTSTTMLLLVPKA